MGRNCRIYRQSVLTEGRIVFFFRKEKKNMTDNKNSKKVDAYVHMVRHERTMTADGEIKAVNAVTELANGNSMADGKALEKAYLKAIESLMRKDGFGKKLISQVLADPMAMSTPEISGTHSGTDVEDEDGRIHVISTDSVRIGKRVNTVWSEIVFRHQIY